MKQLCEPPSPSAASSETIDQAVERLLALPSSNQDWLRTYTTNHRDRIAIDLDLCRQHIPGDERILEVGAVPLMLTASLAQSGYDVTGVDIAPDRFEQAITSLGLTVAACDIEQEPLPFEDASFDAVLFNEIFEHLRINPVFTLTEVSRVLRPGGNLFLSTPNLRSIDGLIHFVLRNQSYSCVRGVHGEYKKLEELGHMGHVREYTTREVVEFLGCVGFEPHTIMYRGQFRNWRRRLLAFGRAKMRPFFSCIASRRAVN